MIRAQMVAAGLLFCTLVSGFTGAQQPRYASLDRLYVKLKEPVPSVHPGATVVLLMYHSYPTSLHNICVEGSAPGVAVECAKPALHEMLPTTMVEVPLTARLLEPVGADTLDLTVVVSADEVAGAAVLHFDLPATEAAARRLEQEKAMPVGEIEIRINRKRDYVLAGYAVVTLGLLGVLIGRRIRMERGRG